MSTTIDNYNNLIPFVNHLIDLGYEVEANHDNVMGYGFYVELSDKRYIKISIFGDMMYVDLMKHNSKYSHDIVNDIKLKESGMINDVEKVKEVVLDYLK